MPTSHLNEQEKQLLALSEKATPGPWEVEGLDKFDDDREFDVCVTHDTGEASLAPALGTTRTYDLIVPAFSENPSNRWSDHKDGQAARNCYFIAFSRTVAPAALVRLEEALASLTELLAAEADCGWHKTKRLDEAIARATALLKGAP